jgi:competence protein ComEC
MPSWDRTLDLVVASHPHSDHIGGLIDVLEQYEVTHILKGFESYDSATAREWERLVQAEGAVVTEGVAGVRYDFGASISLSVVFPINSRSGVPSKDANEDSLVFLFQYEHVRMLFTGDAEQGTESALVLAEEDIRADILKAGHHGSITSTTPTFLATVRPQAVLISVGQGNRYGHPHPVTIDRLAGAGIPYYRTDQRGNVTVTSDGRSFSITTER